MGEFRERVVNLPRHRSYFSFKFRRGIIVPDLPC
jgi:hypothetical protein